MGWDVRMWDGMEGGMGGGMGDGMGWDQKGLHNDHHQNDLYRKILLNVFLPEPPPCIDFHPWCWWLLELS